MVVFFITYNGLSFPDWLISNKIVIEQSNIVNAEGKPINSNQKLSIIK